MDSEELKKLIMGRKSKGVVYISKHHDVIRALINDGEKPGSIYEALKLSECPPPISRSQFYRHLNNFNLTNQVKTEKPTSGIQQKSEPVREITDPKHAALGSLKRTNESIHDSGIDADKLI